MELKTFKIGDTIVHKTDNNIRWVVVSIDTEENTVYLSRKGGYFNEMMSKFNGNNTNFEPAGRTEKRIKREEKINKRQQAQETFRQNKKTALRPLVDEVPIQTLTSNNPNKQIRPKEVAELANCAIKTVLDAIHDNKLLAQLSGKQTGRGVRYLIDYTDAYKWAEQYKIKNKNEVPEDTDTLTVKEIAKKSSLSEATIRNEIKNGNLRADNINPDGKSARYLIKNEWVDEWLRNKTSKVKPEVSFENVKVNPKNHFTPGSKIYGYFETFLNNNNKATYQQLINGCIAYLKTLGVDETENNIKKDLNNKIHHWQNRKLGLDVELDKSQCRLGKKGKVGHGELGNIIVIIKEVL